MPGQIYVNLPVKELKGSQAIFTALGFGFLYGHAFADLDGHIREQVYMEPGNQSAD